MLNDTCGVTLRLKFIYKCKNAAEKVIEAEDNMDAMKGKRIVEIITTKYFRNVLETTPLFVL